MDRIKRLHVDKPSDEDELARQEEAQRHTLLQRLAMVSGEHAPDQDVAEVITDVVDWLAKQDEDDTSVSFSNRSYPAMYLPNSLAFSFAMSIVLMFQLEPGATGIPRRPSEV